MSDEDGLDAGAVAGDGTGESTGDDHARTARRRIGWIVGAVLTAAAVAAAIWLTWPAAPDAPGTRDTPAPTPTASPTTTVAEAVQAALDRRLDQCAQSTGPEPPEHCGIRLPWGTEFSSVTGIRFRIETRPVVELDGTWFTATGGALVATVAGTGRDGAPRTETYRTEDWAVRGDVIVSDDGVDVSVW